MSDTPKCPHCGSAVSSVSGARIFFKCGSYSTTPTNDYTSDLCDVLRELNAANERIKRLVEIGNEMVNLMSGDESVPYDDWITQSWDAKCKWEEASRNH